MLCQLVEVGSLRLPASDPPRPMPEPSWTLCGGFIFASQASAYDGDLNRSMQHFILDSKDGVCAMKRKYHRVGFTAAQKAELWDRWQMPNIEGNFQFVISPPGTADLTRSVTFK